MAFINIISDLFSSISILAHGGCVHFFTGGKKEGPSEKPMVVCYICHVLPYISWKFQKMLSSNLDRN